jgi:hypothetical protein
VDIFPESGNNEPVFERGHHEKIARNESPFSRSRRRAPGRDFKANMEGTLKKKYRTPRTGEEGACLTR